MDKSLSFFQTSAPDFGDDVQVELPAPSIIPEISDKKDPQLVDTNQKSLPARIEYSPSFVKKPPSKVAIPLPKPKENKTSFIKPKDPEKRPETGNSYEVIYEYGKERTHTFYEIPEEQIPWTVYSTRYTFKITFQIGVLKTNPKKIKFSSVHK